MPFFSVPKGSFLFVACFEVQKNNMKGGGDCVVQPFISLFVTFSHVFSVRDKPLICGRQAFICEPSGMLPAGGTIAGTAEDNSGKNNCESTNMPVTWAHARRYNACRYTKTCTEDTLCTQSNVICLLECWKIKITQIIFKKCDTFKFKVFVLTQRSFWTWAFYCLPSLCGRPLDITDHLGLTDMRLWELRRAVRPVSDRHCDRDWSKIGVLVDRANRARCGGQRASSGRARTKGVGPGWKSGGHLGGGQGT